MTEILIQQDGKKLVVSRIVDGKTAGMDKFDHKSKARRTLAAKSLGLTEPQLLDWIDKGPGRYELEENKIPVGAVIVRELEQNRENGTVVDSVLTALRNETSVTQVIDWESKDAACCLDIDYHDVKTPERVDLDTWVTTRVSPRPIAWHFSRSGGLHLFYVAADPFTAEELAAVAALRWRMVDPTAKVELKRMARGPGDEKVHYESVQDTTGPNSSWLSEKTYDADEVQEWCDERAMRVGGRYNHDKCPIAPSVDDGKYRQPVCVSETGVYCFVCEGHGRAYGSARPGFAPWPAILDHPSTGDVGLMVRNQTHWGHARWVFTERYGLPEWLAKIAYKAACKSYHGEKYTDLIFHDHTRDVLRVDKSWRDADGYQYPKEIGPLIALFPQCRTADGKVSESAVCLLSQTKDISRHGFPDVEIVHGCRLAKQHLPPPLSTHVARPHAELIKRGDKYLPRYIPKNRSGEKRKSEDWAWDQIEKVLPCIDRRFVKLAICAIGTAQETRLGMLPLVFVSGPSGSGKTATVKVVGGILGAGTADVMFQSDETRYLASIRTGKQGSCALLFNEILKEASRAKNFTTRQALDVFLGLSETALSHVLHVGPVALGRLPACFMSEPCCPPDLREETQLARRIRDYRVNGFKAQWEVTLPAVGLRPDNMHMLRTVGPDVTEACNVILSEVVDEFFLEALSFDQQCKKLGVYTIEKSPEFENPLPYLRDFYKLVCAAPEIENERVKKQYPGGYKQICKTDDDTDLASVYSMFADGPNPPEWCDSRKLKEKDWSGVIKADQPVQIDLKTNGVSVFVRFRVGPYKTPLAVNEQIVDPSLWSE